MIALDTNVLIRLLTEDDARQSARAQALVSKAEADSESILLDDIVLAETMWTMARHYKQTKSQLVEIARGLLGSSIFEFENRSLLEDTIRLFESSSADFSDCLIVARNAARGCRSTLTFDVACARLPTAIAV